MVTVDDALGILGDKHLLICGGTESERLRLARGVVEKAADQGTDVYELPPGLSNMVGYLYAVQEVFPIFSPIEFLGWLRKLLPFLPTFRMPKSWMSLDQVNDMQLDWVELRERSLIFWPEAEMDEGDDFREILRHYVAEKFMLEDPGFRHRAEDYRPPWFRLVATVSHVRKDLHENLRLLFTRDEEDTRSETEIAREHLGVVDLGERESGEGGTEGVI